MTLFSNLVFWVLFIVYRANGYRKFYIVSLVTALISGVSMVIDQKVDAMHSHYHGMENIFLVVFRTLVAVKALEDIPNLSWGIILVPVVFYSIGTFMFFAYQTPLLIIKFFCGKKSQRKVLGKPTSLSHVLTLISEGDSNLLHGYSGHAFRTRDHLPGTYGKGRVLLL